LEQVRALIRYATGGLVPDLTILLDLDVEVGLKRKAYYEWNRLDAYTVDFHRRVRAGYYDLINLEPSRWVLVNAERNWDLVQQDIIDIITRKLSTPNWPGGINANRF